MTEKEFHQRFRWLYPHLEEAGRRLRTQQRNRSFNVHTKEDGSRVTDADRQMSDYWMDLISRAFPGETIVCEEDLESHNYQAGCETTWFVDPIDGTSKFIDNSFNYYVLISICIDGQPSFGILYQPERNVVLFGNPHIRARLYTSLEDYREIHRNMSWLNRMPLIVKGARPALRSQLEEVTHLTVKRTSNSSHNIVSPLNAPNTGFVSFRKTAYWDLAAPAAIMESAGYQSALYSNGDPTQYNDGNVHCDRFYCLPPDTPEHVLSFITSVPG